MADVQVTCITKPHPQSPHEHITHLGARARHRQHRRQDQYVLRARPQQWEARQCGRGAQGRSRPVRAHLCRRRLEQQPAVAQPMSDPLKDG